MKAIINIMIYDYDNFIRNGFIIFDDKIHKIGPMNEFEFDGEVIDGEDNLLLPGLINSHTHIYSTLFRGLNLNAHPHNFKEVLDQIWWKFDKHLDLESIEYSAKVYAEESLKAGVTSLIDHHASGVVKNSLRTLSSSLEEIGMKHLLCFETSDRFDLEECIAENKYAVDNDGYFGLHASMSLSNETLEEVSKHLNETPIHIHVAESLMDQGDCLKKYDMKVINRLDSFGILNENSILAHCIHIDEKEAEVIKKNRCYIALNPTSNLNNAVGMYKYDLLKSNGIRILVGTDGLGVNVAKEWQNLYYVGKQSVSHPSGVDFDWIKESLSGSYHNFNDKSGYKTGKFEEGYNSDFLLVDYKAPTEINEENIFSHVFFSIFDNLRPRHVFVDGIGKILNYKLTEEAHYDASISNKLWERIKVNK